MSSPKNSSRIRAPAAAVYCLYIEYGWQLNLASQTYDFSSTQNVSPMKLKISKKQKIHRP